MILIVFTFYLALPLTIQAANFKLKSTSNQKTNEQGGIAKTKVIIASGYGINEEKALKNAYKSAIQQFVGVVVDSETQLKNGELIKDNILTASSGFIKEYEKLSTSNENGLYEVKIKALVKSQKIFETMKSLNIATVSLTNASNIQARVATKAISKKEAGVLLKKRFDELLSSEGLKDIISLEIKDVEVMEDNESNGKVPVKITYTISIDEKVYADKIQQLEQLFENLGAKLHKRVDLPDFGPANASGYTEFKTKNPRRMSIYNNNCFFIVKKYGQAYKTDIWEFPGCYKDLCPCRIKLKHEDNDGTRHKTTIGKSFSERFELVLEISKDKGVIIAGNITRTFAENQYQPHMLIAQYHRTGEQYTNLFYDDEYAPCHDSTNGM